MLGFTSSAAMLWARFVWTVQFRHVSDSGGCKYNHVGATLLLFLGVYTIKYGKLQSKSSFPLTKCGDRGPKSRKVGFPDLGQKSHDICCCFAPRQVFSAVSAPTILSYQRLSGNVRLPRIWHKKLHPV